MYGFKVKNPLLLIVVFVLLDLVLVNWLGIFSEGLSWKVIPVIISLWLTAVAIPEWRC